MAEFKPAEIHLVIFDCDGVLIDSELISGSILIRLLGEVGVTVDAAYVQRHFLGRSFAKVAAEIRESFRCNLAADFEERYRRELAAAFAKELRPVAGVEAVLVQMGVPFCMATSSSPQRAAMSLELSGLAHHFDKRVFTSSQVANGKPAPDLFLYAASAMGVAPDRCLVIEDSSPGIEAAVAAGMKVWRFVGASHLRELQRPVGGKMARVPEFRDWADFFRLVPGLQSQPR
jgi:HAD superfamily hydrolase (TIGR01509 family)